MWRFPTQPCCCSLLPRRGPQAVLRFVSLGAIAGAVLGLSFGPFVAAGQLPQVRWQATVLPLKAS